MGAPVGSRCDSRRGVITKATALRKPDTVLAMLKEQVTNPDPVVARKVPQAEREARMVNLRTRLNGILIEGHGEPSHSLLDSACQMYDQNILRYIPLEKCYSRLTELAFSGKPQAKLLEIESSKVVVRDRDQEHEASVQSSYQALESCKRRGLALDVKAQRADPAVS